jgi:protoheme IX farnesyltransferase
MSREIHSYLELCKVRISLFSAFAAATGFALSTGRIMPQMIVLVLGVFLLACGSSALNQYQERDIDARMPRTKNRPIPSGRVNPADAFCFSLSLICLGIFTLAISGGMATTLLGIGAVFWYNGIYTSLKKKTSFAVIPGALVGAVPVALGWAAGGGALHDPKLWMVCFFFFMWQVPHSWLLILNYGGQYEAAGLPSLTSVFSRSQLLRINFIWISASAVSCLLITSSGVIRNSIVYFSLFALSAWLIGNGVRLFGRKGREAGYAFAFSRINAYMFFVMFLLTADKLFGG